MNHEITPNANEFESPWANFSMRELPNSSQNRTCNLYLREIERQGLLGNIAHFIDEKLNETPETYTSINEFCTDNPDYIEKIDAMPQNEKSAIREYSGFRFTWINSYLRGFWDYDKMGQKTPEIENQIKNFISEIDSAFSDAPATDTDFITFRGVNLDSFKSYGIEKPEDLKNLKGQFYVEDGFTSTSIAQDRNFAEHKTDNSWHNEANIEIRYLIPANSKDSIALLSKDLSYNPEQTEVLLRRGSLSYIYDVSKEDGRTIIQELLIPHKIYEPEA